MAGDIVRGKPVKFAEHYAQATLFWNSQTRWEKAHIVRGFRFELTKVQVPAIRERTLAMLRNVSEDLARAVAEGLGVSLPRAMPRLGDPVQPEVTASPALSLNFRPGDGGIRGRKVAILIAPGVDGSSVRRSQEALVTAGAGVRLVAARLGALAATDGAALEADATFETMPSVLFDAAVIPDGEAAATRLSALGQAHEFLRDQYRHGKAILVLWEGRRVAEASGIPPNDSADWAIASDIGPFIEAIGKHRNWERASDPPRV
jgi:catalase